MFKCSKCKKLSDLGEKQETIILETRPMIYYKLDQNCKKVLDKNGKEIIIGEGREIVKEIRVCQKCKGD